MFIKLKNLRGALLAALIIALYSYRLNFPSVIYFDELHYTRFFHSFIFEHKYLFITVHPLLWGLVTWPFLVVFGERMLVWRMVSLLAGLLSILVVYALAKRISQSTRMALLAVFFFTLDCISMTQARIAMMNSLCLLLMLLSLYAFLEYWLDEKEVKIGALLKTGLCLGLAMSTKLTSLSMVLMIYLLFIQKVLINDKDKVRSLFNGLIFLFILPILIYFTVYLWMFSLHGSTWHDIWFIQQFNFNYNLYISATQTHGYTSPWWGWPLLLRPIWFYFGHHNDTINAIMCIGNPAVFWMIPVMVFYLFWGWLRQGRSAVLGIILFGFLVQWLFYALCHRMTFFHYFYVSMPFVAMGLALACDQLWRSGRAGRSLVFFYLILVLGMFIYWYPLLTGLTISEAYYRNHIWFSSWI